MEHRLGSRHAIDLEVYVRTWGSRVSAKGRLKDLSVSGGFVSTRLRCRPLLQVTVQILQEGQTRRTSPAVEGLVVRLAEGGFGIEWSELQPELVAQLVWVEHVDDNARIVTKQCMQ